MKFRTITAFSLIAGFAAAPVIAQIGPAQRDEPPKPAPVTQTGTPSVHVSPKASKAIADLQAAVKNKDYASVPAKVAAANAVASTANDHYVIGKLQMVAAVAANDNAGVAAGLDAVAASGYPDPQLEGYYVALGGRYAEAKQFPQADAAFQKALALNPRDTEAMRLLGVSEFQAGQKAEAAGQFEKLIQASTAAGQKPSEDLYRLAVQSAFDAKSPEALTLSQQWVAAYPSPDSWENSIAVYRGVRQPDAESEVDLFRLLAATGALRKPNEYALYIERLGEKNNWNEARAALDAATSANVISATDPTYHNLVSIVRSRQPATAADLATAAKTAASGTALIGIGDRYYAMGDYAQAVEAYRSAMGKPGVDAAIANLHIGMALARSGDKTGATAALNSVTGPRSDVAKYWLIYVNQKG
jgi:tetratricopeptide (TPR) repeat protein